MINILAITLRIYLKNITTTLVLFFLLGNIFAQKPVSVLSIVKTDEPIEIDGVLSEKIWAFSSKARNFTVNYPTAGVSAASKTEVILTYDDKNLYIAAICHDEMSDKTYVAQSLKRDFSFPVNDAFAVFIDADQGRNAGQSFAVSPYGVQRDGVITLGGVYGVTTAWNGYWQSQVAQGDGFWSVEMSIPFKTLRYAMGKKEWFINFARNDLKRNETSTWSPVPRGVNVAMLGHTGVLQWDAPPPYTKSKVTLVPYAIGRLSGDEEAGAKTEVKPNAGIDARVAITSSLNLDVTINPDFSQVEVDQQVINLSRFEVSFPERRLFFVENSDMFSLLGISRVRPFFSRRIGAVGAAPVSILGGVKLSGDINKNWRIGFLDVHTKKKEGVDDAQNFMVASVSRKFTKGQSANIITGFITNRQAFEEWKPIANNYNFTGGIQHEYRYNSEIRSLVYSNFSRTQEHLDHCMAYGGKIRYKTPKVNVFLGVDAVNKNYITDMGFVRRLYHTNDEGESVRIGYTQFRTNGSYRFYFPKTDKRWSVDYMEPFVAFDLYTNNDLTYQEHKATLGWKARLHNTSEIELYYTNNNPILFYHFQLSGLDSNLSPGNYNQNKVGVAYHSGKKHILNGSFSVEYGQKYIGKQFSMAGELNYRPAKWGAFSVSLEQQELFSFPEKYGAASLTLIGAKSEFSFSKDLFWTTFVQYNTQEENVNINTRFQWRYQPLSDIFLVLTNNQGTAPYQTKDWSIALKVNYWLNL